MNTDVKGFPEAVLRLWYDFMVVSDRNHWDKNMREYLGPKICESFDEWEWRCRDEMVILSNFYFRVHDDLDDFKRWYVPKEDSGLNELHLTINLDNPKIELKKEFAKLIDNFHNVSRGRHKDHRELALIQPNGEVRVKALRKTLDVYKAYQSDPKARAVDVAIGALSENPATLEDDYFKRRSVQAEVARQRAKGAAIIAGVEVGRFPNPNKPPGTSR